MCVGNLTVCAGLVIEAVSWDDGDPSGPAAKSPPNIAPVALAFDPNPTEVADGPVADNMVGVVAGLPEPSSCPKFRFDWLEGPFVAAGEAGGTGNEPGPRLVWFVEPSGGGGNVPSVDPYKPDELCTSFAINDGVPINEANGEGASGAVDAGGGGCGRGPGCRIVWNGGTGGGGVGKPNAAAIAPPTIGGILGRPEAAFGPLELALSPGVPEVGSFFFAGDSVQFNHWWKRCLQNNNN